MKIAQTVKKTAVDFWNDEDAQGMIEYILILVAVVGIISLVGPKIKRMISVKADALGTDISGFTGQ